MKAAGSTRNQIDESSILIGVVVACSSKTATMMAKAMIDSVLLEVACSRVTMICIGSAMQDADGS